VVSTAATYSPWVAGHIPQLAQVVRWVALPGIFSFSNLIVYSEVVDRARALEQKMSGFEIGAKADRATEQLNPNETCEDGKTSRYIGVHFRLSVRNRDREADSTVELIDAISTYLKSLRELIYSFLVIPRRVSDGRPAVTFRQAAVGNFAGSQSCGFPKIDSQSHRSTSG